MLVSMGAKAMVPGCEIERRLLLHAGILVENDAKHIISEAFS